MKTLLISVFIIIIFSIPSLAQSPGSFRATEKHGLGFSYLNYANQEKRFQPTGFVDNIIDFFSPESMGIELFYDYAINQTIQLHFFLSGEGNSESSVSFPNI